MLGWAGQGERGTGNGVVTKMNLCEVGNTLNSANRSRRKALAGIQNLVATTN